MKTRHCPPEKSRTGVAAVEFAVSLPLLMMLLLGAIDVGRFVYNYTSITNATSEGATFASLRAPGEFGGLEPWAAAVRHRAIMESGTLYPPIQAEDIEIDESVLEDGLVSVEVSHTFTTLVDWPGLPHTIHMGRKAILSQTP